MATIVSFEGADGAGKTTQAAKLAHSVSLSGMPAHVSRSLNDYLSEMTERTHAESRQWRLHSADPVEYARLVIDAQTARISDVRRVRQGVAIIDRGAKTLEAGCLALADLRGRDHAEVAALFAEARFASNDPTDHRIALLYSRNERHSLKIMEAREPSDDPVYIVYLSHLYARLLRMELMHEFDATIWTRRLSEDEVWAEVRTRLCVSRS